MEEWEKPKPVKSSRISRNPINLWLIRRKETGNYGAKVGYQQGYRTIIHNLEEFREFARKRVCQTQEEMAEAWQGEISDRTIGKALRKIGFTRKKKLTDIEKEMKTKEKHLA